MKHGKKKKKEMEIFNSNNHLKQKTEVCVNFPAVGSVIFDVGAAVKNIFMPAGHSTGTVKVPGAASHNSGTFYTTNPK